MVFATVIPAVIQSLGPLLLMILAGAVARRLRILPENTSSVLNGVAYYLTMPALIFYSMATTRLETIMRPRFAVAYLLGLLLAWGVGYVLSRRVAGASASASTIRASTASLSNSAFLGLPIMLALFGESPHTLVICSLAIVLPKTIVVICTTRFALFDTSRTNSHRHSALAIAQHTSISVLTTPMIGMALAGIAFSGAGLTLPAFVADGLRAFGMASIPCALLGVGFLLAGPRTRGDTPPLPIVLTTAAKMLAHPLLAAGLLWLFGLPAQEVLMGALLAGLPPAALAVVLAERYRTAEAETAVTLLAGTLAYPFLFACTLVLAAHLGVAV